MGCNIVRQECLDAGLEVIDLHDKWQRVDVIMVGLYWYEHIYDLISFLAAHGIQPDREKRDGRPVIFAGGQLVSYNPAPISGIADYCCIGDGEAAAPAALLKIFAGAPPDEVINVPGIYSSALDNLATWQQHEDITGSLRFPFYNTVNEVQVSGIRTTEVFERRVELARGCRRKCLFCGVSWTKKYREAPSEHVADAIKKTSGAVKCFAPDYMAHSAWQELSKVYDAADKYNQARDISTRIILQRGFGKSRVYSTGIDGLSQRIRSALCKPLDRAELIEVIEKASGHMGSLGAYQILDLPGETEDDYVEWFETLLKVKLRERPPSKRYFGPEGGFYLLVRLNSFCPTPHTPLQWEGVRLSPEPLKKYTAALDILGPRESRKLQHKILGRPHGAGSRILEAAALRADREIKRFLIAAAANKTKDQGELRLIARRTSTLDALETALTAKDPAKDVLPWERRVRPLFNREALVKAHARYHKCMDGVASCRT